MQKQVGDFSSEITETNVKDYVKLVMQERDKSRDRSDKK